MSSSSPDPYSSRLETVEPQPFALRSGCGSVHLRLLAFHGLFASVPPFVASRLRTQALRAAGVSIGAASIFWGLPRLVGTGPIAQKLKIGTYCGFNEGCLFDLEETITIGDHVAVGHDVLFLTRSADVGPSGQRAGSTRVAPIVIGPGAWLGSRSVILPGVTVGASSVVGAGLVISKDVPENTLLAGGPPISIARWR